MAICSEEVPPELTFDGVRVACHLYHEGDDGRPVTEAPADAIGADRGGGRLMDKPLLELRGLEVHFPIRRGIVDSLAGRRPRWSSARSTGST